jgi:hypothetical protein
VVGVGLVPGQLLRGDRDGDEQQPDERAAMVAQPTKKSWKLSGTTG